MFDLQEFVDDDNNFPVGMDILIIHGIPVYVSGEIQASSYSDPQSYIDNLPIDAFNMSAFIENTNLVNYMLPVKLKFQDMYTGNELIVTNEYPYKYSAYYYQSIEVSL